MAMHQYEQEVRLAVVMYGGVSLAIYMNGITQELLQLVRATAPHPDGSGRLLHDQVSGTAAVYRDLARMLRRTDGGLDLAAAEDQAPVRTRFVIDVLSGTSAGGINAVFLAKALVFDQSIDGIRRLWMTEAGIENLINDKDSVPAHLSLQDPPQSLLNGERLYVKLLEAFDAMDTGGAKDRSPYVDDALDLYVTTTDIAGLALPLRLQFQQVRERRHKNVFHVSYRALADAKRAPLSSKAWPLADEPVTTNQFAGINPFLAFAARCTSSFPFAFEPMTLERAQTLYRAGGGKGDLTAMATPFFQDYLDAAKFDPAGNPLPFSKIAFGDGGYLDNKPFGHTIQALGSRASSLPAIRKLLYIEPTPERPQPASSEPPNVLQNVVAAAFTLPTYETIREDVQRVARRNRLIERVRRINAYVEEDLFRWLSRRDEPKDKTPSENQAAQKTEAKWERRADRRIALDPEDWRRASSADMVARYGPGYGGYQRLRVSGTTDELADMITRATGLNRTSNHFVVIRELIRAWRNQTFPDKAPGPRTYNEFLYRFDLQYPLRRLAFMRVRINDLAGPRDRARELAARLDPQWPATDAPPEFWESFSAELARLKSEFAYLYLRLERECARLADPHGPVARALAGDKDGQGLGIDERVLDVLRAEPTDASLQRRAADLIKNLGGELDEVHERIRLLIDAIVKSYKEAYETVEASADWTASAPAGTTSARYMVRRLYEDFEIYDFLSFPVLATSDIGEPVPADIIRISPRESSALGGDLDNPRLAGVKIFNFGAFLERHWRENDMLWGRLHGAEQLIHAFLPTQPNESKDVSAARTSLIRRAHVAIFDELIRATSKDVVGGLVSNALMHLEAAKANGYQGPDLGVPDLRRLFESSFTPERLRDHYAGSFKLDDTVESTSALRALSRSTIVVGKMLEGLSDQAKPVSSWVVRTGRTLWAAVEVSVPGSVWRAVFLHWTAVVLIASALLIIVGMFADIDVAPRVGWIVALGVLAANAASGLFKGYFQRRWSGLRTVVVLVALAVVALAGYGAVTAWQKLGAWLASGSFAWLARLMGS